MCFSCDNQTEWRAGGTCALFAFQAQANNPIRDWTEMTESENTDAYGAAREPDGRFGAGNPGKPKGSRNKLAEAFISDMQADWEQHGVDAIVTVREKRPDVYLKVVASILPRDLNVNINPLEDADDAELISRLRDLESIIRPFLGAAGGDEDSARAGPQKSH